jgi:hypothetical protein
VHIVQDAADPLPQRGLVGYTVFLNQASFS